MRSCAAHLFVLIIINLFCLKDLHFLFQTKTLNEYCYFYSTIVYIFVLFVNVKKLYENNEPHNVSLSLQGGLSRRRLWGRGYSLVFNLSRSPSTAINSAIVLASFLRLWRGPSARVLFFLARVGVVVGFTKSESHG